MRTSVVALSLVAFTVFAAVDAEAFGGSRWKEGRGQLRTRAEERKERRERRQARRAERRRRLAEAGVSVEQTDTTVSQEGVSYRSPAQVNERNTGSQSRVDVASRDDMDQFESDYVASLESFLSSELRTVATAKPEPLQVDSITVTKVKVRGNFKGVKNFKQLVGAEVVQWEGVLSGGPDDGVVIKGTVNLSIKANRDFGD